MAPPVLLSDSHVRHLGVLFLTVLVIAWAVASLPLFALTIGAVAVAASVLLLRWPWIVWPALAIALPVASGTKFGVLSITELLLLVAVCLWLMDGARRNHLRTYSSAVFVPLFLYVAVMSISLLRAPSLGDGIAEVVKWAEFALALALLPVMVRPRHAVWMGAALVTAGVLQGVGGIYQFTFRIGPDWFVILDRFMRASGSFRQPNPYAGYLGVILPVAFSLAIWAWLDLVPKSTNRVHPLAWALFFTGGFVVIAGGMLASWSRGGWFGAAAALFVVIAVRSRKGLVLGAVAAMTGLVASLVGVINPGVLPSALGARFQGIGELLRVDAALSQPVTDDNFALLERLAHWAAGYRMWEHSPWLGIGAGNYASAYENFRLPLWEESLGHAHNLYLNTLAETGLIGLAAFALMWFSLAIWTWRHRSGDSCRASAGWCAALAAGVLGSMTHIIVHSVVDVLFVQGIYLTLGLLFATLAAVCSTNVGSIQTPFEERRV